jgi:hypothetical protein
MIWPQINTRWFKYDRDDFYVNKSQFVPVIFEPPCTFQVSTTAWLQMASRIGRVTLSNMTFLFKIILTPVVNLEQAYDPLLAVHDGLLDRFPAT